MKINKIRWADNKEYLKNYDDNTFDSIITDPPYGIKFMNKKWDYQIPDVELWQECLRVLKPGGHILVACGTRTHHRMTVNIEDVGFEIRDTIAWVYGSGFPKNYDIGKAYDKKMGNKREIVGRKKAGKTALGQGSGWNKHNNTTTPQKTKGNSKYEGYGTALKPSLELWTLARKPLSEKTIVDNVLKWGTGGINIDGCRIGTEKRVNKGMSKKQPDGAGTFRDDNWQPKDVENVAQGRFPANLIHDGSEEVMRLFPITKSGTKKANHNVSKNRKSIWGNTKYNQDYEGSFGSAARFFYCPKASKRERGQYNDHATVKPISLMRYLVRLITPKEGIVLDPFCGSGSTLIAAYLEEFQYIGIDNDKKSVKIAKRRLDEYE